MNYYWLIYSLFIFCFFITRVEPQAIMEYIHLGFLNPFRVLWILLIACLMTKIWSKQVSMTTPKRRQKRRNTQFTTQSIFSIFHFPCLVSLNSRLMFPFRLKLPNLENSALSLSSRFHKFLDSNEKNIFGLLNGFSANNEIIMAVRIL